MRSQQLRTLKENQTEEIDKNMTQLLPARMDLELNALTDLQIAVLPFPFAEAVKNFCSNLEQVLSRTNEVRSAPYRQLNNGLLACVPTLTHGFEKFFFDRESQTSHLRALAVGTPNNPLRVSTPQQMHEFIQIWAQEWTRQLRNKQNQEINSACDRFLEAIATFPSDWRWLSIQPEKLAQDIYAERSLGFQAIPSLLSTFLHETVCTIRTGDEEQEIRWRKVQGDGSNRTGLFLVSRPFRAEYTDSNGKEREGYFAYRLDFRVQTQAGRFNAIGKLKPWIFTHLSCQRYAHEPLVETNYDRNISILMGMNEARLSGYDVDSTLVRLVIDNSRGGQDKLWKFQLPELLAAFKARELIRPKTILANPAAHGNLDDQLSWQKDEYYIVHAEGYKYQHESRKRNHSVKPGFSLRERGDIVAQVLELLNGTLIPDGSISSDIPAPSGRNTPLAMRDYDYVSQPLYFTPKQREKLSDVEQEHRSQEHRQTRQQITASVLQQALQGEPMHLFLLWYERETYDMVHQQIRDVFLLSEGDDFPTQIKVHFIHINDSTLLEPLDRGELTPKNTEFYELMRKQHAKKRDAWRKFLRGVIPQDSPNRFAVIEIGQSKRKGVHPRQSIYGAVREACALEKISSQMLQTVKPKSSTESNDEEQESYSKKTKGRVLNAVLDITLRQIGGLYGSPSEIYIQAGLPASIAQSLDIIALCRCRKNQAQGDVHYAIAVRLRATGVVDVMLPSSNEWIPYSQAGFAIGQIFPQARSDRFINKKRINSQIKLSGAQLAEFAARIVTQAFKRPTLILIEADGWRNERGEDNDGKIWSQLKNEYLLAKRDVLDFQHVPKHNCEYHRKDPELENLSAIIRLRTEDETPQYIPNRDFWSEDRPARSFMHLSGFCDESAPGLLHYFSIGRLPKTQKTQDTPGNRELYMLDEDGANIAFKHQQIVEMVPFFVHPTFQTDSGLRSLCRVPHYLRSSPSWIMGNLIHPYPMHLGQQLIEDQLCILGMDT